jgi:23S rRNA (cytidine1920-2'-O)/16S rRNA (cytidine1409-2'-O)-methyltransferase
VSRGGYKLEGFLKDIEADVKDKVAIDIGASTGGFTDCLIQAGAKKVYSVDVGYGQLAWKLREMDNVIPLDKMNAHHKISIEELVDLAVIDVSFISVVKILPNILPLMKKDCDIFVLVKPQFEARKAEVPRGGIIVDPMVHAQTLQYVSSWGRDNGLRIFGIRRSVIRGTKGNTEFFINFRT